MSYANNCDASNERTSHCRNQSAPAARHEGHSEYTVKAAFAHSNRSEKQHNAQLVQRRKRASVLNAEPQVE